jgi:imidazolonepropionase-like amidohydrolase
MKPIGFVLLGLLALALPAGTQEPTVLVLTQANLIEGVGGPPSSGVTVVVRGRRIESVAAGAPGPTPDGATLIDLKGKYLLPGLMDAHVHIAGSRQATVALKSGVTTVRSMGVSGYADVGLRELGRAGAMELPEVIAAGYHVRPQLAEPFFFDHPSLAPLLKGVRGPQSFRQVTAALVQRKVDWIKTTPTERAGTPDTDPRIQTMSEEEMAAVVEEAKKAGISVAAHAHGDEGGMAAVRAGVRSLEHGTYLSESTLRLMKEKGSYLVPTVAVVRDLLEPGGDYDHPGLRNRGRHMLPRLKETVARAQQIGVKIVAATDTGYGPESTVRLAHDIEELVASGLTPLAALQAATSIAAELFGIAHRTGAVKAGLEADLIVVERNPLEDILTLQDVLLVVNDGRIVVNRLSMAKGGSAPTN